MSTHPTDAAPAALLAHLSRISAREIALPGIPVGAVLVRRSDASAVSSALAAKGKRKYHLGAPLCWKDGDATWDVWLVLPVNSNAAALLAVDEGVLRSLAACGGRYFPGIRRCDPCLKPAAKPDWRALPSGLDNPEPPDAAASATFTFAEFFAGIGGFRLGLEPLGGRCVFAAEVDPACRETYVANFGAHGLGGDVSDAYAHDLPKFDLLTAGFPCQPFSQRGQQGGFDDPRGQLFHELTRTLVVCQPKAFLFENVPALATLGGDRSTRSGGGGNGAACTDCAVADGAGLASGPVAGAALHIILDEFAGAGYHVSWRLLNAHHVVPQKRVRLYIAGFRDDSAGRAAMSAFRWPDDSRWEGEGAQPPALRHILEPADAEWVERCALTPAQWQTMCEEAAGSSAIAPASEDGKPKGKRRGIAARLFDLDGAAPTLISSYRHDHLTCKFVAEEADGTRRATPRFLTPRECARLMGFPERFVWPVPRARTGAAAGFAESSIYRQMGNAVVPPMIEAIGRRMLSALGIPALASAMDSARPVGPEDGMPDDGPMAHPRSSKRKHES